MFIKILLLSIVIGIVGINTPFNVDKTIKYDEVVTTESFKQRNYQHNENVGNTVVTYKFETNEVNSVSDLVVGHTYLLDLVGADQSSQTSKITDCTYLRFLNIYQGDVSFVARDNSYYSFNKQASYEGTYFTLQTNTRSESYVFYSNFSEVVFTYYGNFNSSNISMVSALPDEYNIIQSVSYNQPTTVIGYINEFFEENLLGEIPFIRDINFEIGGQQINLLTWVVMLIGFVIVGLLILAFIKLIIWLVKLFSNSFLLR